MSLVITTNIREENSGSNVFQPYSYQNALLNTMVVNPNSEIALQSCKINLGGLIEVDNSNSVFQHFFGPIIDGDAAGIPDLTYTTSIPFTGVCGTGTSFNEGFKVKRNVEGFAEDIQTGMTGVAYHPSLITGVNTSGVVCTPKYNADPKFIGYEWKVTQQTALTLKTDDFTFKNLAKQSVEDTDYEVATTGEVKALTDTGFYVQNRQFPITSRSGIGATAITNGVIFDFKKANDEATADGGVAGRAYWMVGLSRINKIKTSVSVDRGYVPSNYNIRNGDADGVYFRGMAANKEAVAMVSPIFADICVMRVGDDLRLFQSCSNGKGELVMKEIIYYGGHNTNFGAIYDLDTNAGIGGNPLQYIRFSLQNEEMSVYVGDNKSPFTFTLLCDYDVLKAAGGEKNEVTNPISACKWAMYPVMAAVLEDSEITLECVQHYTAYPEYAASTYANYDMWGFHEANRAANSLPAHIFSSKVVALEQRFWNDFTNTSGGLGEDGLLEPLTNNAGFGMDDYFSQIITVPSRVYGASSNVAPNTAQSFGFLGRPVTLGTATSDVLTTITSETIPKMISHSSLFVRLNNFTQMTQNARQGTVSKILAHLPRFDNSGNETGGLYFEPHEKTYVKLNNPDKLLVNSFDVDIVYDNETHCKALSGKTIVCFHIRDSK